MKANKIQAGKVKMKITKQEIRRRLKADPEKTIKYLKDHRDKLPEALRRKLARFLEKRQNTDSGDIVAIDETLSSGSTDEVIFETEEEESEGEATQS